MNMDKILRSLRPDIGKDNQRNRELWLREIISKIPSGGIILDAGAGTQRYKRFCGHLKYVSQDFAKYDGIGNKTGLHTGDFDYGNLDIVSDITEIPATDSSFDAIMCIEVLEHLPEPIKAIKEFSRLLRKGGHLILSAPFCSLTHFAPYHYYTGFTKYWYEKYLREYKFDINEIVINGNYVEYVAQEICRMPSVINKYANIKVGFIHMFISYVMLLILRRVRNACAGSSELLCYGIQVHARKI